MSTTREMPRYQSHKEVHALKIASIASSGCNASFIVPEEEGFEPIEVTAEYVRKHNPQMGGYFVIYADGYKSYSPAKAFEEGYTALPPVYQEPDVRRTDLPPAEKELTLYADDSPARPGNSPQLGDSDWTLKIPLHDTTRLHLHVGRSTWDNFVAMLAAYAADEADAQM
jgi:hypothetical protein